MEAQKLLRKYSEGQHWYTHPTAYAERFASFLKRNGFQERLVDVGCGNGRDVYVFQSRGIDVIGIDYSPMEIHKAREKFPDCKFQLQNVEKLKFQKESIGAYYIVNLIHYVNQAMAIWEMIRTLKENGYLFIHFNLSITDKKGKVDYEIKEREIDNLVNSLTTIEERKFERLDKGPVPHKHQILELILKKEWSYH